jgi:hypothetical protein
MVLERIPSASEISAWMSEAASDANQIKMPVSRDDGVNYRLDNAAQGNCVPRKNGECSEGLELRLLYQFREA